ncbi:MAG: hypothetical protein FWG90_13665 [Oscillospiraceae bacterium]|nr:hypothetical protein [Oscillospiraceae bacterium]
MVLKLKLGNTDTGFSIVSDNNPEINNIANILYYLFAEFKNIFGLEVMTHKKCSIDNSIRDDAPITCPHDDCIKIYLITDSWDYSRMFYQLAHEMMHYVYFKYFPLINQDNFEEKEYSSWNEEIICEAMALYMLKSVANSKEFAKYSSSFDNYLKKTIIKKQCDTTSPLKIEGDHVLASDFHAKFNKTAQEEEHRAEHTAETMYLYELFKKHKPEVIAEIYDMYKYYNKDYHCINYDSWQENPNFIEELSKIQPILK